MVSVSVLKSDPTAHFKSLHMSDVIGNLLWTEKSIIESRAGRALMDEEMICENHRNKLGLCWKQPTTCLHPEHTKGKRCRKSPTTRVASLSSVNRINEELPYSFPLGGKLCTQHRKASLSRVSTDEQINMTFETQNNSILTDPDYEPTDVYVDETQKENSADVGSKLTTVLDISPCRFQINESRVDTLAESTKRSLKRKMRQVGIQSMQKFAESVAPGQGKQLFEFQ